MSINYYFPINYSFYSTVGPIAEKGIILVLNPIHKVITLALFL
ncbi:protein of unknown function [Candidatus Nitrosocosmicus franklandus]|uniref:Uncharacterized protein n=1 Tax=Candidatus Nitrosocosmicus franklandianus TaxID=1798806 RepID=A0A484I9F5_9ARCH|nr:protein of unknown function [Candidatus Nitrosocosmicus franklandus]